MDGGDWSVETSALLGSGQVPVRRTCRLQVTDMLVVKRTSFQIPIVSVAVPQLFVNQLLCLLLHPSHVEWQMVVMVMAIVSR